MFSSRYHSKRYGKTIDQIFDICQAPFELQKMVKWCFKSECAGNYDTSQLGYNSLEDYYFYFNKQEKILDICQTDETYVFRDGTQELIQKLVEYAENLDYVTLFLNSPVTVINEGRNPENVDHSEIIFQNKSVDFYQQVVLTAPIQTYNEVGKDQNSLVLNFKHAQPDNYQKLYLESSKYGNLHKFYLIFSQKFWYNLEASNFGPDSIFQQHPARYFVYTSENYSISANDVYDRVYNDLNFYTLIVYAGRPWIDDLDSMSLNQKTQMVNQIITDLSMNFGDQVSNSFLTYFTPEKTWNSNPFSRGAYIGDVPLGYEEAWKATEYPYVGDHFYFGGTDWDDEFMGFMEGGVRNSKRIAERLFQ